MSTTNTQRSLADIATGFSIMSSQGALDVLPRLYTEEAIGLQEDLYERLVFKVIRSTKTRDLPIPERRKLLDRVIAYHKSDLKGDQPKAYDKLLGWIMDREQGSYFQLRGYAGTGKTHLARKIPGIQQVASVLGGELYSNEYCAPTHKAKNVLSVSLGQPTKTIYSFLKMKMEEGESEDRFLVESKGNDSILASQNVMVHCDEMSMLPERVVTCLRKKTKLYDLRTILFGDPAQLNPVGEDFSSAFDLPGPKVMMREILRSDNTLVQLSAQIRGNDYAFKETSDIHLCRTSAFGKAILDNYDPETSRVIAWRNRTVNAYNAMIRKHLGRGDELEPNDIVALGSPVLSAFGKQILANTDDEFLVTSVQLKVASFSKGLTDVVPTSDGLLLPAPNNHSIPSIKVKQVELDELSQDVYVPEDYDAFQAMLSTLADLCRSGQYHWKQFWAIKNAFTPLRYAYCLTCHRAQGSTYDRVFVDVPDILANSDEREAQACLYVAATRPSQDIFLRN